ncbi:MAG: aminoglycoside phosphotransferase family protein [Phreatobacter sp.]
MTPDRTFFQPYLSRWGLTADGAPFATRSSRLLPVLHEGRPAMLKIAVEAEERTGGRLMVWWDGDGAARVFAHDDHALLMERATGDERLAALVRAGHDDAASRIICTAAARLHSPRRQSLPKLVGLDHWFRELGHAAQHGGLIAQAAAAARRLLSEPRDPVVLHGDIHHGNILDFGPRGWLAIDPKGLFGERDFDFVNLFRNPDEATALSPGRFARQLAVVTEAAGLQANRLLQWILAFTGLSAVWQIGDGEPPDKDLAVAALAAAEIARA